ncbi:hypothetical protein BSU01_24320 [Erwinia billingiae]|uniref:arylamine N-acetyltransferase family protein n=1 Tax=Erwinia billingiae TaxID=182337 RepID=UPI0019D1ACC2|nr:arylamine N-acetyltransferase [Erwinia billingiae]MBN7124796.1 hypothetical protein [Erwinia billingiae]
MDDFKLKLLNTQIERVLEKLQIPSSPVPSLAGLEEIYRAWCLYVPFDNIRKRITSTSNTVMPLPGANPEEFFSQWLTNGTGGTCWAGHGALYALLKHLSFPVQYGISTMLSSHPASLNSPGHGTLLVPLDNETYVIDATMLHGNPLPLIEFQSDHPVWGTRVHFSDGHWCINWKPLGRPWLDCKLLESDAADEEYPRRYELSRYNSRFDGSLLIRMAGNDTITGIVKGELIVRGADGTETHSPLSHDEQCKMLIEHFGINEETVFSIPKNEDASMV